MSQGYVNIVLGGCDRKKHSHFFFKKKIQEKEEKNKSHGDLCYVTILDNVFVKTEKELKDVGSRDK